MAGLRRLRFWNDTMSFHGVETLSDIPLNVGTDVGFKVIDATMMCSEIFFYLVRTLHEFGTHLADDL